MLSLSCQSKVHSRSKRRLLRKHLCGLNSRQTLPPNSHLQAHCKHQEQHKDSALDTFAIWAAVRLLQRNLSGPDKGTDYGWGFDSFVAVTRDISKGKTPDQQVTSISNFLNALFPEFVAASFRRLFPVSQWAAESNAKIASIFFTWLVGETHQEYMEVSRDNGLKATWKSAVKIEKCRYLESSGCKGMCINLCKRPTQQFFTERLGLPLTMKPNFEDSSCEMRFGEIPPPFREDAASREPCFSTKCPSRVLGTSPWSDNT